MHVLKKWEFLLKGFGTSTQPNLWDSQAKEYEKFRINDPVYKSCVEQVSKKLPNGTSLCLDAGCGTGIATINMANRAIAIVALDYSLESLKVLKSKGEPNVFPVQADISALPFLDSVFDYSACINTLQHFRPGDPQEEAISEIRRVTKPQCNILISVHHFSKSKQKAGWIKEGKPGQIGVDYVFRFERKDLLEMMPRASIVAVGYYRLNKVKFFGCRMQNMVANLFGRAIGLLGFGHMLVGIEKNEKD